MIRFKSKLWDAQLLRALGHASYGGAAIGECLATAHMIAEGDSKSWHDAWSALGDRTFRRASESEAAGSTVSARDGFLRASNYYRTATIFLYEAPLPEAARAAARRHREAFARAGALMPVPPASMDVSFDGARLPSSFFSAGPGRRPVVVSVGGYDSTAEESYFWNVAAALERGYHAVTFDGPGQGATLFEQGIPFRPDWGSVISAVIDAVAAWHDAGEVVVIGESFGGYLAPLAAARDRRIAALVVDPAQMDLARAMRSRLPLPASLKAELPSGPSWVIALLRHLLGRVARKPIGGWALRRGMLTHGVGTAWDYFVEACRFDGGDLALIGCPTLVCDASGDEIASQAREFFETLVCEKDYVRFTAEDGAGDHCEMGNRPLFHARVFDWLDARFAARVGRAERAPPSRESART